MAEVEMYIKGWCPYCVRASKLLTDKGISYREYEVSNDPQRFQEMLNRSGGRMTVPQIFIGDTHIGGSDDLAAAERSGRLDELLAAAGRGAAKHRG